MSLVTAARSTAPSRARHSASTSAVLPDPTGPPMPTWRRPARAWSLITLPPCLLSLRCTSLSGQEEPAVGVGVLHAGDLGQWERAAHVVSRVCSRHHGRD